MALLGDWGRLAADLEKAATLDRYLEGRGILQEYAQIAKEGIQERIGHYQSGWAPLAPATKDERARAGFAPDDPLLRTGEMRDAIQVTEEGSGAIVIDIPQGDPQAVILAAQEFGTTGSHPIPPRPVVGPTFEELLPEVGEAVHRAAAGELFG